MIQMIEQHRQWSSEFSQLEREMVAALPQGSYGPWWNTAKDLLRHLAQPLVLTDVLRSLINTPERLQEVANRSISHSLGFDKIVLIDPRNPQSQQTPFRLRLHLWWPQTKREQSMDLIDGIHNHFTDFSSVIIKGTLTNQIYAVNERGSGDWYHYKALPLFSNATNRQSNFPLQGRVGLTCLHEADLVAGSLYHLPYNTLHNSFNDTSTLTATLLIYGQYETQEVDMFRLNPITEDSVEVMQRFTPTLLAETLERFIAAAL